MNNKSSRPSRDFARGIIIGKTLNEGRKVYHDKHSVAPRSQSPKITIGSFLGWLVGFVLGLLLLSLIIGVL